MAGYSKTTLSGSLISHMADYSHFASGRQWEGHRSFHGVWRALQGIETANIIRKRPVKRLPKRRYGWEGNFHHRAAQTPDRFNQN